MSGQQGGSVIGAIIGGVVGTFVFPGLGTGTGAALGGALGGLAGGLYDSATAKFDDVVNRQERLADQAIQTSTLGIPMPQIWGTIGGLAGNIWWASEKTRIENREEIAPPGGKGPLLVNITVTYTQSYMIRLCDTRITGPMAGLTRIMENSNLFWDVTQNGPGLPTGWTFYPGTATQDPDPTIEADANIGVGNVPRWPYTCYVVVADHDLGASGQTPIFTFWVSQDATEVGSASAPYTTLIVNPVDSNPWVMVPNLLEVWEFTTGLSSVGQYTLARFSGDVSGIPTGFPMAVAANGDVWIGDTVNSRMHILGHPGGGTLGNELSQDYAFSSNIVVVIDIVETGYFSVVDVANTSTLLRSYNTGDVFNDTPITYATTCWLAVALNDVWVVGNTGTMDRYELGVGVVSTIPGFGEAWHSVATPADEHVWVADRVGDVVRRLNTTTEAIVATVAVGDSPTRLCVASDGYVWVACEGAGTVQRINPATNAVVLTVTIGGLAADSFAEILAPGAAGGMWVISAGQNTVTFIDTAGVTVSYPTGMHPFMVADAGSGSVWVTSSVGGKLEKFPSGQQQTTGHDLATVVTALCTAVGQTDIDLTDLPEGSVNLVLLNVEAARVPLEQLALAFRFYAVESGFDLKFRERGSGGLVFAIGEDELGASENQADETGLRVQRLQEADLPTTVEVAFVDPGQNYQRNTQPGQLALPASGVENARSVNVGSVAMQADEARQLAYELAVEAWVQREVLSSTVMRKYCWLEPGDRGTLTARGLTYTVVIGETAYGSPGLVEFTARVDAAYIRNAIIAVPGIVVPMPQQPVIPGDTEVLLINVGALDSNDVMPRFHAAFIGENEPWEGGGLYRSIDSQASFQLQDAAVLEGITGTITGTPPDADWHFLDTISVITVVLEYGSLSSISDLQLYNGGNLCAIGNEANGWELLSFGLATLTGPRTYELTRLLRGRRGSEHKVATHVSSEAFVLIDSSFRRIAMTLTERNITRHWKAVTAGQDIADVTATTFAATAANQNPWSVAAPEATLTGSDWTLAWKMRSRFGGDWVDGGGISFDVDFVGFKIEIFTDGTYATVVRTILTDGGSPLDPEGVKEWLYTAADQTTDHGSPQAQIWFRIFQVANNGVSIAEAMTAP